MQIGEIMIWVHFYSKYQLILDGNLDLAVIGSSRTGILRNLGNCTFQETSVGINLATSDKAIGFFGNTGSNPF